MPSTFFSRWRRPHEKVPRTTRCSWVIVAKDSKDRLTVGIFFRYFAFVTSGPVRPPFLGDLETAVMDHLWAGGSGDAPSVHRALGKRRGITYNTIQSTLKRLFKKGLLQRDKVSHSHVYQPLVSREEFHRGLLGELVGGLMRGQADVVVSAFVDLTERAGPEHLERLAVLVAERRRKPKGGSR